MGEGRLKEFLQEAAQTVLRQLRENDIGVRYDASTLAIVLPETRGKDLAALVERIRKMIGAVRVGQRAGPPFVAGMAEAVLESKMEPADIVTELINRLEAALEAAQKERLPSKLLPAASPGV